MAVFSAFTVDGTSRNGHTDVANTTLCFDHWVGLQNPKTLHLYLDKCHINDYAAYNFTLNTMTVNGSRINSYMERNLALNGLPFHSQAAAAVAARRTQPFTTPVCLCLKQCLPSWCRSAGTLASGCLSVHGRPHGDAATPPHSTISATLLSTMNLDTHGASGLSSACSTR